MNQQQLLEIVRRQLKEMITEDQPVRGVDCDAVTVPHATATDLGAAHKSIIDAVGLMEKAKQEAHSEDLKEEIQKVQDSLIRGATQAIRALVCLLSMESQLDE